MCWGNRCEALPLVSSTLQSVRYRKPERGKTLLKSKLKNFYYPERYSQLYRLLIRKMAAMKKVCLIIVLINTISGTTMQKDTGPRYAHTARISSIIVFYISNTLKKQDIQRLHSFEQVLVRLVGLVAYLWFWFYCYQVLEEFWCK